MPPPLAWSASQVAAQAATSPVLPGEGEPEAEAEADGDGDGAALHGTAGPPSGRAPAGGNGAARLRPLSPGTAWTVPRTSGAPLEYGVVMPPRSPASLGEADVPHPI